MPDPVPLLIALLIPALAAAAVICAFLWTRKGGWESTPAAGAAAAGFGYLAGHIAVRGVPSLPPGESTDWIFYLAMAAALIGLVESRLGPRAKAIGRLLISTAVPVCLLWRPIRGSFEVWWTAILLPALGGAVFLLWTSLEALGRRRAGLAREFLVLLSVASASAGVLLSGSLILAQLGGALAASLGAAGLAASLPSFARKPRMKVAESASGATAVVLSTVLINGRFYAELSWTNALLFFLSLFGPWIAQTMATSRLSPRWRIIAEALSVLLPLAAALGLAFAASPSFDE